MVREERGVEMSWFVLTLARRNLLLLFAGARELDVRS